MYLILDAEGKLRRNRREPPKAYDTEGKAKNFARAQGDSVVEVELFLDEATDTIPAQARLTFIRNKRLV